jgi:N-acetylglutamate synthase-like GNAT family acetyltransferase
MPPTNNHVTYLGYDLDYAESRDDVADLLAACNLDPVPAPEQNDWSPTAYLSVRTRAGGMAACVGWNRSPDTVVLHSLAVAPSSRRQGIGTSLVATAIGDLMDRQSADAIFLTAHGTADFFRRFGFNRVEPARMPTAVARHPVVRWAGDDGVNMVRRYPTGLRKGLDQCAFRVIHNERPDATLPPGSVFLFEQSGNVINATFRGGPVDRGHLMGLVDNRTLSFAWHHVRKESEVHHGEGRLQIQVTDDGRRELTDSPPDSSDDQATLVLREV